MKHWKVLKESLKLDKKFLYVLLFDILFYAIFVPCFILYAYITNRLAQGLEGIMGTDLQSYLSSASQLEVNLLTADLSTFLFTLIFGAIILFVIGLFSYSLSRTLIWNYLLKKKFSVKKYFKFNLLNFILFIAFAIIFAVYALLMVISRLVLSIILVFFILAIFYFIFALYIEYTKTGRIFQSIGNAFKLMDKRVYLLSLPVFIIIGFISVLVNLFLPQILSVILSILLIIIFASWMRIFVVDTQKD